MGYDELRFEPAKGPESVRLRHVEHHLVRQGALLGEGRKVVTDELDEQCRRIGKLEQWRTDALVWIGTQKVRWGVVSFATGIIAAVATALLTKWMGG